jgi:molybdopterin converting factor small subunit
MKVTVKLFAHFRNIAGTDQVRVDRVEGATSHICRSPLF